MKAGFVWPRFLIAGLVILVSGCFPMGSSSGKLFCETESGDFANVHEIYGTWKMTRGYSDGVRTPDQLEDEYDVLLVQTGGGICRIGFAAQAPIETVMLGTYSHNVNTDKLEMNLTIPFRTSVTAKYTFGNSCASPTMRLEYLNEAGRKYTEEYVFRSKDVGDGCPF